ncbi:Esterase PHB depolymerase [Dyella jiangningensis]|uniref:PHB depolymerase family esterase n=1 Tax=Dyella sp. AtDHG13 TaxID=1938897 RepID=UPI000882A581|nr:PHB depolymerase family esterase [Dyella sp. AtDHG13]PXV58995.1 esterase/PHB depolymerase [Dyella sp. AtDHG13]SDL30369.1 Esterase PHB depolymerase [Dyella jiangningensis]
MNARALLLACLAWLGASASADEAPTGVRNDVTFSHYSKDSGSAELVRRLVTPLNAWRLQQHASASGIAIQDQPVDLTQERFALYVPAQMPPDGYALLVFVPPWDDAKVPADWTPVLDRHGMIFVTAARIGNDTSLLDRRDPVSLLAAINVMATYHVNPQRVYVAGLSGGSRVAQRLALGYTDLFHGVLLEAGSDPLGKTVPLPPASLLAQFQTGTRVVYLTGQRDTANLESDRVSRQSLREWCIEDIDTREMPWTGHVLAGPTALDRALTSLETHHPPDASKLDACRSRIAKALDGELDKVRASMEGGRSDDAKQQLDAIDQRYGGLAAPRSVELAARLQQATP